MDSLQATLQITNMYYELRKNTFINQMTSILAKHKFSFDYVESITILNKKLIDLVNQSSETMGNITTAYTQLTHFFECLSYAIDLIKDDWWINNLVAIEQLLSVYFAFHIRFVLHNGAPLLALSAETLEDTIPLVYLYLLDKVKDKRLYLDSNKTANDPRSVSFKYSRIQKDTEDFVNFLSKLAFGKIST